MRLEILASCCSSTFHAKRIATHIIQAALFPCGISLAATWDTDLIHEVGQHIGDEVKTRSAHVLLAPTVCLHRGPLGGRNFESFSEDPFLTGKLAASFIKGVQEKGVAATIKRKTAVDDGLVMVS